MLRGISAAISCGHWLLAVVADTIPSTSCIMWEFFHWTCDLFSTSVGHLKGRWAKLASLNGRLPPLFTLPVQMLCCDAAVKRQIRKEACRLQSFIQGFLYRDRKPQSWRHVAMSYIHTYSQTYSGLWTHLNPPSRAEVSWSVAGGTQRRDLPTPLPPINGAEKTLAAGTL